MEIIAHRGCWKSDAERNTKTAFERAFGYRFGIETDFRDYRGRLVVSHDLADADSIPADEIFSLYKESEYTLAINIKADGVQELLRGLLERYRIRNYFCFDMSVPDTFGYIRMGLHYFVRESEYEKINSLYDGATGVWMDGFSDDSWITMQKIDGHLGNGKRVCIVSSELHGRDKKMLWDSLKTEKYLQDERLVLCTDHPEEAKEFFYGKNQGCDL